MAKAAAEVIQTKPDKKRQGAADVAPVFPAVVVEVPPTTFMEPERPQRNQNER